MKNIRIVLVRTFHPGNIGSSARAMKTMGLDQLVLAAPRDYEADVAKQEARKMASSAEDLLDQPVITEDVKSAVDDCGLVIACTARPRSFDLPCLNPDEAAQKLLEHQQHGPAALMFGPERMGLHNSDIELAHYRVTIPANPDYSSLNLASAVQILCYELRRHFDSSVAPVTDTVILPDIKHREHFFSGLEALLYDVGFLKPQHPGQSMDKLRHLLLRGEPSADELNLLQGVIAALKRKL